MSWPRPWWLWLSFSSWLSSAELLAGSSSSSSTSSACLLEALTLFFAFLRKSLIFVSASSSTSSSYLSVFSFSSANRSFASLLLSRTYLFTASTFFLCLLNCSSPWSFISSISSFAYELILDFLFLEILLPLLFFSLLGFLDFLGGVMWLASSSSSLEGSSS